MLARARPNRHSSRVLNSSLVDKCLHQPACPGCPEFGAESLPVAPFSLLEELAQRFSAAPPSAHPHPGRGYRHRVRLSVRGRRGQLAVGIFRTGTHELVAIPGCPVHHPLIEQVLSVLVDLLNDAGIPPYVETSHTGLLRAIQLAVSTKSSLVQVTLLVRDELGQSSPVRASFLPVTARLSACCPVSGVFVGALPQKNNSLLAERYVKLWGEDCLTDEAGGASLFFPPDAFGQANPILHERVLSQICELLPERTSVFEYYAGVGSLGLGLLRAGHHVRFNEISGGSLQGLKLGLQAFGEEPGPERIFEGRAGDHAGAYRESDTVLVDPPRKGLDPELLTRLKKEPPLRLIYLSCGLASFLKEADELLTNGGYRLAHLSGWGYFPFTEHLETLAVFERREG